MAKTNNTISKNVLDEAATPQQVTDAIKKRYEVKIKYGDEKDQKGSGQRLIQPVAYGTMKGTGNPVIRAFQPFGDTKTKVPHWKMFRLDKIDDWKPLKNRHFDDPSKGQFAKGKFNPTGGEGAFNPNGDKSMDQVFIVADFEGAKQRYNQNLKAHNDEINRQKVEQDPFYNLKQNIKKSIKGDPEIMKRVAEWQRQKDEREKRNKLGPNQQSSREMASISSFGNNNTEQTIGPIQKGQEARQVTTPSRPESRGYRQIAKNGPVYKGSQDQNQIRNTQMQDTSDSKESQEKEKQVEINDNNNNKNNGSIRSK